MRKITMKSTKSTSENGGSVRENSEDRATNFSDADNDDPKQDTNTEDANKSFDNDKSATNYDNDKHGEDLNSDAKLSEDEDNTPEKAKTPKKAGKQRGKKGASNTTPANGKAGGKRKVKRKKTTPRRIPPKEYNDEKEYEVEKVVGKKKVAGKIHYLIRWKGYSAKDDSWEAEDTLNCQQLIKEYLQTEKKSPAQNAKKVFVYFDSLQLE